MTEKKTRVNENSLKNLKKFTSEYQPSGEAKSLGKLKKKTLEELKQTILDKSFKLIADKLDDKQSYASLR